MPRLLGTAPRGSGIRAGQRPRKGWATSGCDPTSCLREGRGLGSPWRRLLAAWRTLSRAAAEMDADSLLLSLELASGSGQGLSPDRRASLLTSLLLVKRDYRYSRVLFWGRILGLVADYYIAQGLDADQLAPRKTLYRCSGGRWAIRREGHWGAWKGEGVVVGTERGGGCGVKEAGGEGICRVGKAGGERARRPGT